MFNVNYVFAVMIMSGFIMLLMWFYMVSVVFLKFLIMVIYVSGIVVFILYISCMCWGISSEMWLLMLVFMLFSVKMVDYGSVMVSMDFGGSLWVYIWVAWLFNFMIVGFSRELFSVVGSLRI